jgi:GntR family transcriptional regulator, transcriptional repressor for pyruvate dehydrogenase complex
LRTLTSVRRVRKAYEQVADQLRSLIVSGNLSPGDRLPNEVVLAREFGVSRATVREALRMLAVQRLIITSKGPNGGSYVASPEIDFISEFMNANINLLTEMDRFSLDELLEAREYLEVFSARMASERRTEEQIEMLRLAVPDQGDPMVKRERFQANISFHARLMEYCGNGLLYISAMPLFSVLQTALARSELTDKWHRDVSSQHDEIIDAVEARDEEAAGALMREHIAFLRPSYERAWRHSAHKSHAS